MLINFAGITSVYEWEGKIENDSEVLMMIKTRSTRIGDLTEFVKSSIVICIVWQISLSLFYRKPPV